MRRTVYVTPEVMREIAHRLAVSFFAEYEEPLPDFEQHDPALLDSALSLPRASYGGKELYPALSDKAAVMFYSLIKNHPFPNGNKRMATATLLVFLFLNRYWIESGQRGIYKWAIKVAKSRAKDRDENILALSLWLKEHIRTRRALSISKKGILSRILKRLSWLVPLFWLRRHSDQKNNKS